MWLRGWTEADLAELVCRVYVFTCVSPVPCGSGLVSSVPVVFKDFFLKDSSVCLDGSWVFIYPHRGPWIERILHVQLCFSLVIDFWTHAIYVNAHMDLHLTAHACLLPSIIMFLYSLYDITKW